MLHSKICFILYFLVRNKASTREYINSLTMFENEIPWYALMIQVLKDPFSRTKQEKNQKVKQLLIDSRSYIITNKRYQLLCFSFNQPIHPRFEVLADPSTTQRWSGGLRQKSKVTHSLLYI